MSTPPTQPDAVRFLENNLIDLHKALEHPVSHYDSHLRRYVAVPEVVKPQNSTSTASVSAQVEEMDESNGVLTLTAHPMIFWESIFQKSVKRFQALWVNAPKDRQKSGWDYSVRDKSSWESVYDQLQKAREYYDGDTSGLWGRYAKGYTKKRRWLVDHSGPVARQAVKFVPPMDCATPVIAAVQVLVDVSDLDRSIEFSWKITVKSRKRNYFDKETSEFCSHGLKPASERILFSLTRLSEWLI